MGRMVPIKGSGSFWPSTFAAKGGAVGPLYGEEEEEERWGVDQWVYAPHFELRKPRIARAMVGCNLR
jgi:hypothetical protein